LKAGGCLRQKCETLKAQNSNPNSTKKKEKKRKKRNKTMRGKKHITETFQRTCKKKISIKTEQQLM
jgi:hypothetical protein